MQYVTEDYRDEMGQVFRGRSSIFVYLNLVNKRCQTTAHITSTFSGDESMLYDETVPSEYQGVTSTQSDGHIRFDFEGYENNIAGFTLKFKTRPASITITNGSKTETITVTADEVSIDEGFKNCSYIKITPNTGKLSLKSVVFGIVLFFPPRQLMSTTRTNTVNHISNELPQKTFTFSIDNRTHLFNKDNPYGYADYIAEQQVVQFEYHREIESNDSVYIIKGGKVLIKDFSSDNYQAKFTCTGYMEYMKGTFYRGQYYPDGISAYDLAEIVLADAGVTAYDLDYCLKGVMIYNPIPVCEHRVALQYIANASKCTLYEDREGRICIRDADRPSFIYDVTFTGATDYSIGSTLFNNNSLNNYSDAEYQYTQADGVMKFLPSGGPYLSVGFVSSEIAKSNGTFNTTPSMDISFMSEYHMTQMTLNFAEVVPTSLTITLKHQTMTVSTATITNATLTTTYTYDGIIDEIIIVFNKAVPNQRIHLNHIDLKGYIEYELTYRDLKKTPVAVSLERISDLNVHVYNFSPQDRAAGAGSTVDTDLTPNPQGGDTFSLDVEEGSYNGTVAILDAQIGDNLITFDNPYHDYSVTKGTIKESGAYYIIVESDVEQEIEVYAKEFTVTDNVVTVSIHETGAERNCTNQLISSMPMAQIQAAWIKDYYDDDLEYNLTYRGDPAIDADDLLYLQNEFVEKNEIRIESETLNTSAGMNFTCTLKARRNSYVLPR